MWIEQRDVELWASQHLSDQVRKWFDLHDQYHNRSAYQALRDHYVYETALRNGEKWTNE